MRELGDGGAKSLIENGLKHRFSERESWDDPSYLGEKFSERELTEALTFIGKTKREMKSGYDSIYVVSDYEEAKALIKAAKKSVLTFRDVSGKGWDEGSQHVIERGQGTPESFYTELERERRERKMDRSNDDREV